MLFGDASKEKDSFVTLCSMSGEPKTTSDFTINFLTKHLYKEYMHHFYQDLLGKCLGQAMLISSNGQDFWAFWTIYGWSACQRL